MTKNHSFLQYFTKYSVYNFSYFSYSFLTKPRAFYKKIKILYSIKETNTFKQAVKPIVEQLELERQRNIKIDTSNSSKFQNVDGEVDGVYARHGKISFLAMKKFIQESPLYYKVLEIMKNLPLNLFYSVSVYFHKVDKFQVQVLFQLFYFFVN